MVRYGENPPNHTIYVNNLNEKLKKHELKRNLYYYFSQYGNILDINASKAGPLRGQAWLIFEDLAAATRAVKEADTFLFFGKKLQVTYAKDKSDVIAKIDGTYKPRPKRKEGEEKVAEPKPSTDKRKRVARREDEDRKEDKKTAKAPENPPNRLLFVENLPKECTNTMLTMLFQQYTGFREARLVDGKPGIAFVEFNDPFQATAAKDSLQGFKITPTHLMKIKFAR